ncbi:MAG: glutathione S-transferase [Rhodobacteraceae bacterium]|nr:glutathione S-transferase [Paracoccaceae bacterium]
MLTIWGRINSHNVKKIVWLAEEIGIEHRRVDMGGSFGFTDAYLAANPNRLVPTIEDDGFVLWESNTILRYLADRHAPHLRAEDAQARAAGEKWMDWQFDYADAQRDAFLGLVRTPPEQRDEAAIHRSARRTGEMMAIMDAELAQRPWLAGDSFGIADIPMAVYANSWFKFDIERPARPHVERWFARLLERPAFARIAGIPLT